MTGKYKQKRLQEGIDLLATVFESSPYIMMLVDVEGHVEKINRLGIEFAGSTQKEWTGSLVGRVLGCVNLSDGKNCGDDLVCEHCPIHTRIINSLQMGASILNEEAQLMIRKDGVALPLDFLISTVPVKVADETKILVSIVDITERKRAEKALLESEERNRQAVENSPNPIFSINKAGYIQTWNQACEKTFQYGQDIVGKHFHLLLRAVEDEALVEPMLNKVSQGQSLSDIDMVYRSRDGSERFMVSRIYPLFNQAGFTEGYVFANTDMTERKRAAQALQEREAKLNAIFRAAPIGIGMVIERVIHEVNDMLCTMTGYSREELIGKNARFLYPSQTDYEFVGLEKYRQISEKEVGTVETRWRIKNGEIRDILLSSAPIEPSNLSRGVTFSALDITERKKMEAALRESEALYSDLVETAQDLIWQCDREGRYVYLNPAWEKVFGYHLSEMLGKHFGEFQSPEYASQDMKTFLRLLEGETAARYETVHLSKDGSEIQLVFNAKAYRDAQGKVIGTRGTAYDITERKQAEQALQKSEYLLKESQKLANFGSYELDIATGVWKSSEALNEVFGIDWDYPCDVEGWLNIIHPADREEMRAYFLKEVLQQHQSFNKEYRIARVNDGEERWVHGLGKLEFDMDGNLVTMIGNIQDITDRKNAEIALRESAKRYQAVVEDQNEFIVRWKPDGTRSFVNEAYLRYYHLSWEEALSSSFISLIVKEDRPSVEEKISRLLTGKSVSETETHRVIRPDGTIGWQEWTDRVILDEEEKIVELQSVGRDVTERILSDEALRTKTEELEALFSISAHLRAAQSADEMLPVVLTEMRRVLRSDAHAVILLEPDKRHFTYAVGDGPLGVNKDLQFDIDQSISGLVMLNRQPYVTTDLSSDPHKTTALRGDDELGPAVLVPVISESEFLGVLVCARLKGETAQQYSSPEVRLLAAVGEMVGNALRRARLFDQALKRLQYLQTLHSIDNAISANLDLNVILEVLLAQGVAQLNVDAACVLLLDPHTHLLEYAASKGIASREQGSVRLRFGEGLPGKAVLDRKSIFIPNLLDQDISVRKYLLDEGFVAYQAAPLVAKGHLQGVLEVFSRKPMEKDEELTGFLETLATQAAIAIDNSQLFSELQRSNFELEMAYDATIEGWSHALELRDQETEGHTLRVTDMTLRLAQGIGVRHEELIHIKRGALLHDIGKMGVPDRILLKPDKLVSEEWEIMKQHTVYAYEMLWPIQFLRPAVDIPHFHHERWDGSGYPRQLRGDQIPLAARLFAVADVWDALTSNRPYRKAWSEERALDYIRANQGKHFDPRIVELFLNLRSRELKRRSLD